MDGPQVDLDMDGYGYVFLYGLDWIGWIYIRIHTCFTIYNYKAKGTEDAFNFLCLPLNRSLFPPLGNLTPQDAVSELKLQLSRVPLPIAWAHTYCICEYQCFPY